MKKILILTAEKTGTGHKSSANAIELALQKYGYTTKQLDCFFTMGKTGVKMENAYIPFTTKHPYLWKIAHGFTQIFTNSTHIFVYNHSKKMMLKEIENFKPDLIITDHCMFTKAVSKLIKKQKLNIPFMVDVIDLINPPKVWMDKSACISFLPTEKVKQQYIKCGFKPEQLVVCGFPIREDVVRPLQPKTITNKPNILMVNPSVNLKKNIKFLTEIVKLNANITFVCGRDERLFNTLTKLKNENSNFENVTILGFVKNMNELLANNEIVLTKAGPNMLLEATRAGNCVVVTGHIPGQEANNHKYITENGYGIKCENPSKIFNTLNTLIKTNQIQTYFNNVINSNCNDGAKIIADTINKFLTK